MPTVSVSIESSSWRVSSRVSTGVLPRFKIYSACEPSPRNDGIPGNVLRHRAGGGFLASRFALR
jgi:hypothetical protein